MKTLAKINDEGAEIVTIETAVNCDLTQEVIQPGEPFVRFTALECNEEIIISKRAVTLMNEGFLASENDETPAPNKDED